jgi:hypothetical protein
MTIDQPNAPHPQPPLTKLPSLVTTIVGVAVADVEDATVCGKVRPGMVISVPQ